MLSALRLKPFHRRRLRRSQNRGWTPAFVAQNLGNRL